MSDKDKTAPEEGNTGEPKSESDSPVGRHVPSVARYRPLGMMGNPFQGTGDEGESVGAALEIRAASHEFLKAILAASEEEKPKPILVSKAAGIPSYYPLRATGDTEAVLAQDEELGLLHAYVQMYLMRSGRVRSALRILGERMAFRHFETTLALIIEDVLEHPDTTLASYQVLGPDLLEAFKERFASSPEAVTVEYFGEMVVERRPDLIEAAEMRTAELDPDVDGEDDSFVEIDDTLPTATGVDEEWGDEDEESEEIDEITPIVDYVIEHVRVHRSPVVARALRVYRDRGLAAMANEFRITKAPRKTLKALLNVCRLQFDDVVLMFDGFENWPGVPPDLRTKIASSLSDIRWTSDGLAVMVVMVTRDTNPELEEQFASGTRVDWDFAGIVPMEENPGELLPDVVDGWLSAATTADSQPLTMAHPLLALLKQAAGDDLVRFVHLASAAVENAADRGVALDEEACNAAVVAAGD